MAQSFHTLALAPPDSEQGLSNPFAVLYVGSFVHGDSEIEVTSDDLAHAVALFDQQKAGGYEVPIDFEHSFAEGGSSLAAGWIKELYVDGDRLMARVKWTSQARSQIEDGQFRYFSPEFSTDVRDERGEGQGFGLLAGGLTNRPHLKQLGAVALSEDVKRELGDDRIDGLASAFQELAEVVREGSKPGGERRASMADKPAEKTITLSEDQHQTLVDNASKVEALEEKVTVLTEGLESANEARQELAKKLDNERLSVALSQARREGRPIPTDDATDEKWQERLDKFGLDETLSLIQDLPADTVPMTERGHSTDKPPAPAAPEGVDPTSHKIHLRAEEIAAEREIDYVDAASIAYREITGEGVAL